MWLEEIRKIPLKSTDKTFVIYDIKTGYAVPILEEVKHIKTQYKEILKFLKFPVVSPDADSENIAKLKEDAKEIKELIERYYAEHLI